MRKELCFMVEQTENPHTVAAFPVGNTPLLPTNLVVGYNSQKVAKMFDRTWVKWEGASVSGSHKDRIALESVAEAIERGKSIISVATCGNYGYAVCMMVAAAQRAGYDITANVYMPSSFHSPKTELMRALGANIELRHGSYEEIVKATSRLAEENDVTWYDANPGGKNLGTQLDAYARIADEIVKQLGDVPSVCMLPASNGTTLCGVARGFALLRDRGEIDTTPAFIAVTVRDQNPIHSSFTDGTDYKALSPAVLHETVTNEPLINWDSTEGRETLEIIRSSGGATSGVSDSDLERAAEWCQERSLGALSVMPAGAAPMAGIFSDAKLRARLAKTTGPIVMVFTAREEQ
jgi:threonine synthase